MMSAGKPENYEIFVDKQDGYSYYYPSDWRVCMYVCMILFNFLKLFSLTYFVRTGI